MQTMLWVKIFVISLGIFMKVYIFLNNRKSNGI